MNSSAALFVLYTVLGCLVESLGMIVVTVPLLYPVLLQYGIDPIWFGVILVLFIELGQISPPIGINLFVIQSIWTGKLSDVVMGTIPFHLIMFVLLALLVLFRRSRCGCQAGQRRCPEESGRRTGIRSEGQKSSTFRPRLEPNRTSEAQLT